MKPASRIKATVEILDSSHRARVPLNKCVGDYMRTRRYIGSKDRRNVAERVYDITRAHARLSWWLEKTNTEDTSRNRVIAWTVLGEGADEKRVNDLFDGSQYAPDSLNEDEHAFAAKLYGQPLERKDMPDAVRAECPPEYEDTLKKLFGEKFQEEMQAMMKPATLDLRVNSFQAEKENVIKSLDKDGIPVTEGALCPWALRCDDKAFLSHTKAFKKGWIEIQDEGSQLIAWLCGAKPGMQVLDYCAGAGGKTLALAAAMERKGRIVAMDTDEKRLENGRKRYKKAGLADIIEVRALSDERHKKWLKRQKEKFDIVLTDVPCSGSGTWRRNPDTRWQKFGPSLEELTEIQAEIIDRAAKCVKPGGKLVYATCSLFEEENEAQVETFLKNHPEFRIEPIEPTRNLGSPFMRLSPLRHETDGFFTAILKKSA
ncbi:MAG: RsmB/NOP family class I SAM-dependent RNA methyltransferase [Alcanivorax sp.]